MTRALLRSVLAAVVPAAALLAVAAVPHVSSHAAEPARRHMVAAANPLAAEAGLAVLRRGGTALDAAVAVQLVLGLVEPQSSGIGGGAFLLHFDSASGKVAAYDGRETAPSAASGGLFLKPDGTPEAFFDAVVGGRSVGTPGVVAMLAQAHRDHGRLDWAQLLEPAAELAEAGFVVSPRLATMVAADKYLATFEETRAYFFDAEGAPRPAGARLANPAYASVLRAIAGAGPAAFYEGPVADAVVAAVRTAPKNPGLLSLEDLRTYEAKQREPVCASYRAYRICGMPPPSSGGTTVLQIMTMLEGFDMAALPPGSAERVHLFAEASRLAYADRAAYLGDPDFVTVPLSGLLDRGYLAERATLIRRDGSLGVAVAGTLPQRKTWRWVPGEALEIPSTTHFSIVDADGDAVAMTSSVESAFGSRLMVRGFLLNNQLTDFSFRPVVDGLPVANRVEPGKRPLSSMAPTLVFDQSGGFVAAVGSPGGSRIIAYVAQTLLAVLDNNLPMDRAVGLPHVVNRNGRTELEAETAAAALKPALEALGHEVAVGALESGLHGIRRGPDGLTGGADPRREGVVLGD